MEKLTKLQREVLFGILLGDANLHTENQGKTYRLRISQTEKQKDYVFHLYEIFKPFVETPPRLDSFFDVRTGKTYSRWVFSTTQQSSFRFYGQQFYSANVKRVPKIISKITPRAIAYWYMDDGAQKWKGRSKAVRFCTDGFTQPEVQILCEVLTQKYQLKTSSQKKGNNYHLYVSSYSYTTLRDIIYQFLVPSMLYKFPQQDVS